MLSLKTLFKLMVLEITYPRTYENILRYLSFILNKLSSICTSYLNLNFQQHPKQSSIEVKIRFLPLIKSDGCSRLRYPKKVYLLHDMTRLKNFILRDVTVRFNHKTNHAENGMKILHNDFVSLIYCLLSHN